MKHYKLKIYKGKLDPCDKGSSQKLQKETAAVTINHSKITRHRTSGNFDPQKQQKSNCHISLTRENGSLILNAEQGTIKIWNGIQNFYGVKLVNPVILSDNDWQ